MDTTLKVEFSKKELLEQNQALSEELAQCQSDKDFVWNLWKNLQVEKPDIASVVNSVVEREQVKSDAKDLKVLNVLQQKDQQINTLQEIAADLQVQLRKSNERLSDLMVEESGLKNQVTALKEEKDHVESQIQTIETLLGEKTNELETIIPKFKELQDGNSLLTQENNTLVRQLEAVEKKNKCYLDDALHFKERLHSHENKADGLKQQALEEKKSFQDLNEGLETNLNDLKKELNRKIKEFDELQESLEVHNEKIHNYMSTIDEQTNRIQQQDSQIHDLRKQTSEHGKLSKHVSDQCALIKNLEELQDETQKVLNDQQERHSNEITSFRKSLAELTKKNSKLQKVCDKLMEENHKCSEVINRKMSDIHHLKEEVERLKKPSSQEEKECDRCNELEEEVDKLRQQFNLLINKKFEENDCTPTNSYPSSYKDNNTKYKKRWDGQKEILQRQHDVIESMDMELKTTRGAHKQRLERFKLLKENHDLVLKQLATYEEGSVLSPRVKEKAIQRASQRALQHEESRSVWNELEYYKREYNKMKSERPKLKEDLDELKVRVAHDATIISSLKLRLAQLNSSLVAKESELEEAQLNADAAKTADAERVVSSKIVRLESQLEIWKGEVMAKEIELNQLQEKYMVCLQNENLNQQEMNRLTDTIGQLDAKQRVANRILTDASTQTGHGEMSQEVLVDKINQVLELVSHHKQQQPNNTQEEDEAAQFTIHQLESVIKNSIMERQDDKKPTHSHHTTQTSPVKARSRARVFNEQASQTELTETSSATDEPTNQQFSNSHKLSNKKKEKLSNESQRLLMMRSELSHENRSLKKRVVSLETQVCQLRESRHAITKEFQLVQDERDKLKNELVAVLQKLQATRDIVQDRSQELERCTNELSFLLQSKKEESDSVTDMNNHIKSLRSKIKESATEHSHSMVKLTTLEHENVLLTQKLKQAQERVVKLEKSLDQKKNYVGELKERHDELKDKAQHDADKKDELEKKLKACQEREQKNKSYLDQLKKKTELITNEKLQMKEDFRTVQDELVKKSHLLVESQRLCRNAESAITEIEQTAYEQFKLQNEGMQNKQKVIRTRYDKAVTKSNEMKLAIVNFSERVLSQILENRGKLMKKRQEEATHQKNEFVNGQAFDLACSILNMSTSDLQDFLKDEDFKFDNTRQFEENNTREKLQLILQREKNFGKILTKFLADLVNYNFNLLEELQLS